MTVIGELAVNAVVNTEGATKGASAFRREISSMSAHAKTGAAALVAMSGAAAKVGYDLVEAQGEIADATDRASRKLSLNVEELSRLRYAGKMTAELADGQLDSALERMNTNIGMAEHGNKKAAKAFHELGLSTKYLAAQGTEDKLGLIADSLARVSSSADRVRLAEKIFGSGDFALVVEGGRQALAELGDESDRVGATLDSLANKRLADADNAIDKMHKSIAGTKHALAGLLAPLVTDFADSMTAGIADVKNLFGEEAQQLTIADRALKIHNETLQQNAAIRARVIERAKEQERAAGKAWYDHMNAVGKKEYDELQNDLASLRGEIAQARGGNETFGMSELDAARYNRQNHMVDKGLQDQLIEELEVRQDLERVRQREIDAKERDQQLDERAKGLIEQNLTPLEQLKQKLAEIEELRAAGKLSPEQAMRAAQAAGKGFSGEVAGGAAPNRGPVAAIQFGSGEAYRAIRESRNQERNDLPEKQLKELQEGNRLTKEMLNKLDALKDPWDVANWS